MYAIRPPVPAESEIVSRLILQSDCGMLPALFGPAVKSLLIFLQNSSDNPYSSTNTLVIVDEAGSRPVVGAMVGSRASTARRESQRTAGRLFRWYGPAVIARFPGLARAGRALDGLDPDDFYLSHIAVLPEHRGHGAGGLLMHAAEDSARSLGARRLVLDVVEHNVRARAFYARLDYRQVSVVRIDLRGKGVFSFLRLGRSL